MIASLSFTRLQAQEQHFPFRKSRRIDRAAVDARRITSHRTAQYVLGTHLNPMGQLAQQRVLFPLDEQAQDRLVF